MEAEARKINQESRNTGKLVRVPKLENTFSYLPDFLIQLFLIFLI